LAKGLNQAAEMEDPHQLLQAFAAPERHTIRAQAGLYDALLDKLPKAAGSATHASKKTSGILALNGASGAGQSYVMSEVEDLLRERLIDLPRMRLLATRPPRGDESNRNPYIFVEEIDGSYRDIHNPTVHFDPSEIYYFYESRPGAANAILLADAQAAIETVMYLETVVPTLLHIKHNAVGSIPAWGDSLKVVYLASPSGSEWISRLLGREPSKLADEDFRARILGRIESSLSDMALAADNGLPCVISQHGRVDEAAEQIMKAWGL
jgi:hypothetical protein